MNSNKTAVYVRVSTSNGTQKTDSQEYEIKRYCDARGWSKVEIYKDEMSGAKTSRPSLDRMLKDMRNGKVARVVCYKLCRLGRSLTHLALILDEMNRIKVPLICTSQGIDTSEQNACGSFQIAVLMAVAEFERSIIKERVNSGIAAARAKGVRLGRPATLTARRDEVMALKAQGLGFRKIAKQLDMPISSVAKVVNAG